MKRNDILILLIPSFLIIVLWVVFNIYHNFVNSTIPESLNLQIAPISPRFDTSVIDGLKKRKTVAPLYEGETITQPTENESSTPLSTTSGQQASIGGELSP